MNNPHPTLPEKIQFATTTPVFRANVRADPDRYKLVVNQGGGSSGKTYAIVQKYAFLLPLMYPHTLTTITAATYPSLTRGAVTDFHNILQKNPDFLVFIKSILKSPSLKIIYHNGSIIEFITIDTPHNAKYGKRDFLFINEANNISYTIFSELYQRTRLQTTLDFNPSGYFWYNEKIENRAADPEADSADPRKILTIKSTFLHNPYISAGEKSKILHYKTSDPYLWEIYGMGNFAQSPDRIYHFTPVPVLPDNYDHILFGLDFGYSQDPSALIEVRYLGRQLYLRELLYAKGLTIAELATRVKAALGQHLLTSFLFCDSANPQLIRELVLYGLPARPAIKGPNSVLNGINKVKEFTVHYLNSSHNLRREVDNYKWIKHSHSDLLSSVPIDTFNHLLDALRYVVFSYR